MNDIMKELKQISEMKDISFEAAREILEESIKLGFMEKSQRTKDNELYPIYMQRISIRISEKRNDISISFHKAVVEEVKNKWLEIAIDDENLAEKKRKLGEMVKVTVRLKQVPRSIAANIRKIFKNKILTKEKEGVYKDFEDNRIGKIVMGTIIGKERESREVIGFRVDLDRIYGFLPNEEAVFSDKYGIGKKYKFLLVDVREDDGQKRIILSRRSHDFIKELLRQQIPEVKEGYVIIKKIVREPGIRTKISVSSENSKLDPVGACVGPRAQRISEIRKIIGEKLDVIQYSDSLDEYIKNSLKPATIKKIIINKRKKRVLVIVPDDTEQLGHALGRNESNRTLTGELIGMYVEIKKEDDYKKQLEKERTALLVSRSVLLGIKGIDEGTALGLTQLYGTLEDISLLDPEEIMDEFPEIKKRKASKIIELAKANIGRLYEGTKEK